MIGKVLLGHVGVENPIMWQAENRKQAGNERAKTGHTPILPKAE